MGNTTMTTKTATEFLVSHHPTKYAGNGIWSTSFMLTDINKNQFVVTAANTKELVHKINEYARGYAKPVWISVRPKNRGEKKPRGFDAAFRHSLYNCTLEAEANPIYRQGGAVAA